MTGNKLIEYRSVWICLALTLAAAGVFYQVCTYDFVNYDDPSYVYENPNIQDGITFKTIKWAFSTGHASNWHPLTWLSHMLDWQLFSSRPAGHHLTNLIFHIANTLLLFIVLKQMTHKFWPSAFVAALFAIHPLHVESVAWVSERKDVLSTFFWMLTIWAYVRFVRRPKITGYLLAAVFFALGLMAKPMLVTLPFVLLLLDYWPLNRLSLKREKAGSMRSLSYLLVEKTPLFAMAIASCIVTFIVQKKGGAMHNWENYGLPIRLANASVSYMQYIIKMILPVRLAFFYPHLGQNVSVLYAVISAILLLAVTVLVFRLSGNRRYLTTGWLWYLGTLVPVIGLVQVGEQALADRYTYITLTGLFIIIAWGLPELLGKWPQRKIVLWTSSLVILSILAVIAHFQQRYWKNTLTLCEHALEVTDNNYEAHSCMTEILIKQDRIEEAIWHDTEAVRIKPRYFRAIGDLGIALYKAGRTDEAIRCFKKSLEINPRFAPINFNLGFALANKGEFDEAVRYYRIALETMDSPQIRVNLGDALLNMGRFEDAAAEYRNVLSVTPNNPTILNELGYILSYAGKLDEAIKCFTEALRIKPDFAAANDNMGYAMVLQGNIDDAAAYFAEALRINPNLVRPHYYYGKALVQKGKIVEAVTHFEEALRLGPDWIEPMNDLAWFLATSKEAAIYNPGRAVILAQQACKLTGYKQPDLLDTLAAAYAAAGDFSKAIEIAEKALELCQSPEQITLKQEVESRLALYKAGKPYTEAQ